jgi:hypothetical protein
VPTTYRHGPPPNFPQLGGRQRRSFAEERHLGYVDVGADAVCPVRQDKQTTRLLRRRVETSNTSLNGTGALSVAEVYVVLRSVAAERPQ